jgi:hypothetical protein
VENTSDSYFYIRNIQGRARMKPIKSFLKNLTPKLKVVLIITCCSCVYLIINAVVKLIRYPLTTDDKVYYLASVCAPFLLMFDLFRRIRKYNRERLAMRMEKMEQLKEIRRLKKGIRRLLQERREIEAQIQELNE